MMTSQLLLVYLLSAVNIVGINVDVSNIDLDQAYCLAENIYYEARSESTQGQIAVASVTVNRSNDARFPDTICGVVKQSTVSSINKKLVCAFSWYCENNKKNKEIPIKNKDGSINQLVIDQFRAASIVAINVLSGETADNTHGATHFHNPHVSQPAWAYELIKTATIGNHTFYKLPKQRS